MMQKDYQDPSDRKLSLKSNDANQQKECDNGTILASRSVKLATQVYLGRKLRIKPVVTLENPPPSDMPEHLSAWELPEVKDYMRLDGVKAVDFPTCVYEHHLPPGRRHWKPQRFAGTLYNIGTLGMFPCTCGEGVRHDPIVGVEKSRASAEYPDALCKAYAILVVEQFERMAKEEFLREKMKHLEEKKAKKQKRKEGGEKRNRNRSPPVQQREPIKLTPAPSSKDWVGDANKKHGLFKAMPAKKEGADQEVFYGGMRNPAVVVKGLPVLQNLGVKIKAAWEGFVRRYPKALEVAETYGTLECSYDENAAKEWTATLRRTLGARSAPTSRREENVPYRSPLDPEILQAWIQRGQDPEEHVVDWVLHGTPLGMAKDIPTCGIFPPAIDGDRKAEEEWMDTDQQLRGGSVLNYKSMVDQPKDAQIELDRYRSKNYVKDLAETQLREEFPGGTISRLGLIVKEKEGGGVKRRIIVDLRRSTGNLKSKLPERLILPRPMDAVATLRAITEKKGRHKEPEVDLELALIDISDAFMALAVHRDEWKHCVAPDVHEGQYVIFVAMLFGFKTAPLLWSRVAALMSRLLQSCMDQHEGMHQTYLDDGFWALMGTLTRRNSNLSFILYTLKAIGLQVSLNKGQRASSVTWIGVRYTLLPNSMLALTLPEKFIRDIMVEMESWDKRGMIPIKDLRRMCGRVSWLAGILPRTRWTVRVLYGALHDRLQEVEQGAEQIRRQNRPDNRDKSNLIEVKRFNHVRVWLCTYLEASQSTPTRRIQLLRSKEVAVRVITDACPEGLGALLVINGITVGAMASPVTEIDAELLKFEKGQSSSQAVVEALALLVALRHWEKQLHGKTVALEFVSDSIAALTLSQKLSGKGHALNYVGAELAVVLEQLAIDDIKTIHIPGVANKATDWLSRPSAWDTKEIPDELLGVKVEHLGERKADWYKLPTPAAAPEMWGSSVHQHGPWESLRGF